MIEQLLNDIAVILGWCSMGWIVNKIKTYHPGVTADEKRLYEMRDQMRAFWTGPNSPLLDNTHRRGKHRKTAS